VVLHGSDARRVLFGVLNLDTGHRLFLARRRGRGEDFREFLDLIHRHYRGWHPALLLDEDSCHTAEDSQAEAERLGIELLWLPNRSPHLNGLDHLWRHAKAKVCPNRQYDSIDEEVSRCIAYLQALTKDEALLKAGILSEDFWLNQ
jgi:transposase